MATKNIQVNITVAPDDLDIIREAVNESCPALIDASLEGLSAVVQYHKAHTISVAEFPNALIEQLELVDYDSDGGATRCTYRVREADHVYTVVACVNGIGREVAWDDTADSALLEVVQAALREVHA